MISPNVDSAVNYLSILPFPCLIVIKLHDLGISRWKDSALRKPLIIHGTRQVGKTWLVENVLANQFDSTEIVIMKVL